MRIVDLSHPIHTGMQVFPGDPEVTLATVATVAEDGYRVASLHAGTHTGTHLDAPSHSIPGGGSVDGIGLARLVGPAVIVQCAGRAPNEAVSWASVADRLDVLDGITMVLFRTGWSEHFGTQHYLEHPVLLPDVAEGLLAAGISVVGVDTLNPDPTLAGTGQLPFHEVFLGAGGVIAENLANLSDVTWDRPLVSLLPLPLAGADGAPIRAVAMDLGAAPAPR